MMDGTVASKTAVLETQPKAEFFFSPIEKYVRLNEREQRIKRKLKNGLLAGAMSLALLMPANNCGSPESISLDDLDLAR